MKHKIQNLDQFINESSFADRQAKSNEYKADLDKWFGKYIKNANNLYWDIDLLGYTWDNEINDIPVWFILRHKDDEEEIENTLLVVGIENEQTEAYLWGSGLIKKFFEKGYREFVEADNTKEMDKVISKYGFVA